MPSRRTTRSGGAVGAGGIGAWDGKLAVRGSRRVIYPGPDDDDRGRSMEKPPRPRARGVQLQRRVLARALP